MMLARYIFVPSAVTGVDHLLSVCILEAGSALVVPKPYNAIATCFKAFVANEFELR